MAKITKATIKSFVKKNRENLYIWEKSRFDGMYDCVMQTQSTKFSKAQNLDSSIMLNNTLGISGLWLVGGSKNSFYHYEDDNFIGIEVYNCCGSSIVAIPK